MKSNLKWLLTQDELIEFANCKLSEQFSDLDCGHCPVGQYCQDIGYGYVMKLLNYLIARSNKDWAFLRGTNISDRLEMMLSELNKEFRK